MSGPSTRSHRSSVRGVEATLVELSDLLKVNKSVVVITGAGLSAASGIPTFRGGTDSVWSVTAAAQGRRSVFLRDPLRWYNEFFLRNFPMSFTRKTPNPGHEAIAALARAFPEMRVITQNIDGLHQDTVNTWPDPLRLIEAHGRLGLFKCVADDSGEEGDECPYSFDKEITPSAFPESVRAALEDDAYNAAFRGLGRPLAEVPRCPHCGEASPPMSLLFDEDYDSHSFYDFERVEEWFKGADAVVFVGTSFAVTLTSLAIREAKRRSIPVFDFNLSVSLKASPSLNAKTVLGPAEATLPALARLAGVALAETSAAAARPDGQSPTSSSSSSSSPPPLSSFASSSPPTSFSTPPTGGDGSDGTATTPTESGLDEGKVDDKEEERERGGGRGEGGEGGERGSLLGRPRLREKSSPGTSSGCGGGSGGGGDGDDALEGGRALKRARCLVRANGEADAAGGPVIPAVAAVAAVVGVAPEGGWGGGAAFLLDPVLETPLQKENVRVELSEAYSRKAHPDREVEATVEILWQEQLAKNPSLFNGSKFRLAGYSTEGDHTATTTTTTATTTAAATAVTDAAVTTNSSSDGGEAATIPPMPPRSRSPSSPPTRRLHLRLGLTDYRTFRGTNWSPAAARLAEDSARDHPWLEGAYLSQKLGVGAVVETADGFLLSLRRSNGVGEGQRRMDAPGGHPEPEKLGLTAGVLRALSRKAQSSRRKLGQQATEELFDSAVQEVVDETNVPRSALGKPLLSGVVRQGNSFGAPSAAFIIPCSLNRDEVVVLYARGAKEAFESTELQAIPAAEIVAEGASSWFSKRGMQATPSFEGALELWRAHRLRGVV